MASPFQICILTWLSGRLSTQAGAYQGHCTGGSAPWRGDRPAHMDFPQGPQHLHSARLSTWWGAATNLAEWGRAGSEPGSESPAVRPATCARLELLMCLNGPQVTDPGWCPGGGGPARARGPWSTWMGPDPALCGPSSPGNAQSSPRREQRHHLDLNNPWGSGLVTAVSCAPEVKAVGAGRTHTDRALRSTLRPEGPLPGPVKVRDTGLQALL